MNGEFRNNQLTAVMGPSGAGKSTLLNILTGYTTNFESGTITVNNQPRDLNKFRHQAAYIMQDNQLHMHLTPWEAIYFAVSLKIGEQLKGAAKIERVNILSNKNGDFIAFLNNFTCKNKD